MRILRVTVMVLVLYVTIIVCGQTFSGRFGFIQSRDYLLIYSLLPGVATTSKLICHTKIRNKTNSK